MSAYCKYWEKDIEDVSEHEMLDVCGEKNGWDCVTCPYFGERKAEDSSDSP